MIQGRRYVIIGNGIAGTTTAETLRKTDADCRISILTNEAYPLYNRVSLPRLLQGVIGAQKVMMRDFEQHKQRGIDLLTERLVTDLCPEERVVVTDRGEHLPYDALLIASGGRANALEVPGSGDAKHIYNFMTLDDAQSIIDRTLEARTVLAYGGSFIAYELCDGFVVRNLHTTWLMRSPYWLRNVLDPDGGEVIDAIAKKFGVEVIHNDEIEAVVPSNGVSSYVRTRKGRVIQADMIGVGLGIELRTDFLARTAVEVCKGVVVNEYLESNVPGIYAAGDVAEFYDLTVQRRHTMGTWDNALSQGRVAAINMAGGRVAYRDIPTYTSPLFDVNIAVIGIAESHNPELVSIARREPGEKGNENYRKLFFREKKLVGVLMIGSPRGRKKLLEAVRTQQVFETSAEREALLVLKRNSQEGDTMLHQDTVTKKAPVDQYSLLLERRDVYGRGTVEVILHLDEGVLLLEQRSADASLLIPLISAQAKERLKLVLSHLS